MMWIFFGERTPEKYYPSSDEFFMSVEYSPDIYNETAVKC